MALFAGPGGRRTLLDWKYHVTSLVAVFLALGVGIVVGSMVVGDQAVLNQQSSMLARLEEDMVSLRDSNERLRREAAEARQAVAQTHAIARDALPVLVAGRLKGINVVIVTDGQPVVGGLQETLVRAGAKLPSLTDVRPAAIPWPEAASLIGLKEGAPRAKAAKLLGRRLGEAIALGADAGMVEEGLKKGWLARQGEYGEGTGALVVVGNGQERADKDTTAMFVSLARYWRENWGPVVFAAPAAVADFKPYREVGAVTVGDIANPWSQAMVVSALALPGQDQH